MATLKGPDPGAVHQPVRLDTAYAAELWRKVARPAFRLDSADVADLDPAAVDRFAARRLARLLDRVRRGGPVERQALIDGWEQVLRDEGLV